MSTVSKLAERKHWQLRKSMNKRRTLENTYFQAQDTGFLLLKVLVKFA